QAFPLVFPCRCDVSAVFLAHLVEYWISIVDVNVNFAWAVERRQPFNASARSRHGQLTHRPRRPGYPWNAQRFVVAPECPIEEYDIARREPVEQGIGDDADSWKKCHRASAGFRRDHQADRRFDGIRIG